MGWRQDELWFDVDVLWFREPAGGGTPALELHAPAFTRLAPRALVAAIPNGLAESRRRRAELRRRRAARKTRAAAFVIAPTVALTLAGPRPGAAQGGGVLQEDPPTETFGPELVGAGLAGASTLPPRALEPSRAARGRAVVPDAPLPRIEWNRATSHGLQYAGRLSSGTQLPVEGPDWVTWNPVTDSVPNRANRLHGHERTIRRVLSVVAAHREANPDAPRTLIGDISFPEGGPMELHRSHQNGLDVDVYYPRLDRRLQAPRSPAQVDRALAQDLLDRFLAAGAQVVFVGYSTGLRGPSDVVVPYPNHEDHMHVRFPGPRG